MKAKPKGWRKESKRHRSAYYKGKRENTIEVEVYHYKADNVRLLQRFMTKEHKGVKIYIPLKELENNIDEINQGNIGLTIIRGKKTNVITVLNWLYNNGEWKDLGYVGSRFDTVSDILRDIKKSKYL